VSYGKTGKANPTVTMMGWRRNGRTKTWKTRPDQFSIPVKYGLHSYGRIDHTNAWAFHLANECKALAEVERWWAAYEAGAHTGRL